MKKGFYLLMALLLCGCSQNTTSECESKDYVDIYTSASTTKTTLKDKALTEAEQQLSELSNDLATLKDSQVEGYEEPASAIAQIMTNNPDGSVGFSTIHAWKYDALKHEVTLVLTHGQNALNLVEVDSRGSLLVHGDAYYLMHLKTKECKTLEYSDEAYENGEFNMAYSGKSNQLNEYTITLEVMAIESTHVAMFE